jgi:hypothetical protein
MVQSYGLKVTKAGDSVLTEPIKTQRFNSNKGAFKIFMADDVQLTTNGSGNATATIAHNLNYAPGFFVFRKATARWTLLSSTTDYTNAFFPVGEPNFYVKDDTLHHAISAYADEDNLYIQVNGGKPSTIMDFRYYILVDLSEAFSSTDGIALSNDYGFKVSKEGESVLTGQEYDMNFSTKYKIPQYYAVSKKTETLTLPEMFSSHYDDSAEEATYVDFNHGLGYAPLFIAHVSSDLFDDTVQVPITSINSLDVFAYAVNGFADATRIRIYFWRSSLFFITPQPTWPAETVTIRIYIFTEDLAGDAFPPAP